MRHRPLGSNWAISKLFTRQTDSPHLHASGLATLSRRHSLTHTARLLTIATATLTLILATLFNPFAAQAAPGDYTWQKAGTAGITGDNINWQSVASSADGTKLVAAAAYGHYLYTSSDSGATWTERTAAGSRNWRSVASSADGSKLVAGVESGSLYTSSDSGVTWTEQTAAGSRDWQSVASSADGSKLIAAAGYGGSLYTSSDSGVTWTEQTAAGSRDWRSVASSADGTKLVAAAYGGSLYTSSDSGATWTERTAAGSRNWRSVASSADGTKLVAGAFGGSLYTSSDSGVTWTERTAAGSRDWQSVASSADGTKFVAAAFNGGFIYTSSDSGVTWTEQTAAGSRYWVSVASSADGSKLIAAAGYGGSLYTSSDSGVTWTEQTAAGSRYWASVASSADGSKLIAAAGYGGSLYTSSDSGATWTEQTAAGSRYWASVASSADGSKLVAAVYGGSLYTSSDSGVTWTEQTAAGSRDWQSVASSADGTKLVAAAYNGGFIYTSSDSGVTWTEQTAAGSRDWASVASSADGSKLVAGVESGSLYTSSDSGATWTAAPGLNTDGAWYSIGISRDGLTVFAADTAGDDWNGGLSYISRDGGATWEQVSALGTRYWNDYAPQSVAISDDGLTIAVVDTYGADWNDWDGGYIYLSRDGGASWTEQPVAGARSWSGLTVSADGSKLVAAVSGGSIYLGSLEGPATDTLSVSSVPAPAGTDPAVTAATLSITSSTCYEFDTDSLAAHSPTGPTSPQGVTLLGGLSFDISCATTGGNAPLTLTLGSHYADTSTLRVYKHNTSTNQLEDITSQVTISNTTGPDPRTTISYTLTDGGDFDEDGTANGTIVDPIYIGLAAADGPGGDTPQTPDTNVFIPEAPDAGSAHTPQQLGTWVFGAIGILLIVSLIRRRLSNR
jgi:photosystem II stability/assembly factor-like uncharacterized protein